MRLGVCYYPEQWPRERWPRDLLMMRDAGLELVRMGEFAWSSYELARDVWNWGWLDEVLDLAHEHGLGVVLGTPTATPPIWLAQERPDVLAVGPDGRRRQVGSRRHTCPTSPAYREESLRVVTALADRYAAHPAVQAWQVDNEPGNHDSARCWCDSCQQAFEPWLTERYGDVAALNAQWGTAFWSQTWPSFDAVELPRPTVTGHNPALLLAHRRFAQAQVRAALGEQVDLLSSKAPGVPVLTNHYLGDDVVDVLDLGSLTGLVGHDNYPHGAEGPYDVAFRHQLARAASGGADPWVMEQQPGPVNWTSTNPPVAPGLVRLWVWQAALHGVDTLLFFRWRAGRFGQEQYHAGLLRHDASPDRGLAEALAVAAELASAPPRLLERPAADTAVLFSYEDAWALDVDPHAAGFSHRRAVVAAYEAAARCGRTVDVVPPTADLTSYSLVLTPALHLATPERVRRLHEALDAGATVVLGPRSLVKDADDAWVDEPVPAGLADRLGARVSDGLTDPEGSAVLLGQPSGGWTDVFATHGAQVLHSYEGDWRAGLPAVVRRDNLVAVGVAGAEAWTEVLAHLLGVTSHPAGVEVLPRADGSAATIDWRAQVLQVEGLSPSL
jgi:beta-galactosidase